MEPKEKIRIPPEIFSFFMAPGGHSLIVRGKAGTGKTTFALQVIEDLGTVEDGHYVSTRVSDESLLVQFPWLKDRMISPFKSKTGMEAVMPDRMRGGLTKMKGIGGPQGGPVRKEMSISIGKEMSDIELIYEMIEKDRDVRRIFVIDSIDALADRYGVQPNLLITSLQKDLVEGYGQNLLYVLESPEPLLDYLGDGVVVMNRSDVDRRRVREIELLKLRGCEITRPRYLFTLMNGKMMTFNLDFIRKDTSNTLWSPISDMDGKVSSGMPDLDRLIGGGIDRG
ncbi:MAG: hypothetical protein LLG16_09110, partial [Euryarchaeota archaeon]|nr:hypothetical protein [Euryarchaeota archaeon]